MKKKRELNMAGEGTKKEGLGNVNGLCCTGNQSPSQPEQIHNYWNISSLEIVNTFQGIDT